MWPSMRHWIVFGILLLSNCTGPLNYDNYKGKVAAEVIVSGRSYTSEWPIRIHRQGLFSIDAGDANEWALDPINKLLHNGDGSAVWIYSLHGNLSDLGTALATATSAAPITMKPLFIWYDDLHTPSVLVVKYWQNRTHQADDSRLKLWVYDKRERLKPTGHELFNSDYYDESFQEKPLFESAISKQIFAELHYVSCKAGPWREAPVASRLVQSRVASFTVTELGQFGKYCEPNLVHSSNPLSNESPALHYVGAGLWSTFQTPLSGARAFYRLEDQASEKWPLTLNAPYQSMAACTEVGGIKNCRPVPRLSREQHQTLSEYVRQINIGSQNVAVSSIPPFGGIGIVNSEGDLYLIGYLNGGPLEAFQRQRGNQ